MTEGYWVANYWPDDYWVEDYWPDYGEVIAVLGGKASKIFPIGAMLEYYG
jgi:hypothetical protein